MHRLHHPLEHRVEDLARLLREQFHGALEVGEQHRQLLALAFEGGLRSQDTVGQVPGCVRIWGREIGPYRTAQGGSALAAESVVWRVGGAAARAGGNERSGALPAKLHPCEVMVLASRTLHAVSPRRRALRSRRCRELSTRPAAVPPGSPWHRGGDEGFCLV